jgi:hypothetical protein
MAFTHMVPEIISVTNDADNIGLAGKAREARATPVKFSPHAFYA